MNERLTLEDLLDGMIPSHGQDSESGLIMIIRGRRVDLGKAVFADDVASDYAKTLIRLRSSKRKINPHVLFPKKKK